MGKTGRRSGPAFGRLVGVIGLLTLITPRLGHSQQAAAVRATVRVVVSVASENRALVSELASRWGSRAGPARAQGSLALVRLSVVAAGGSVGPVKPAAIVDIQYLRN